MRSGENVIMCGCDLDMSDKLGLYRPERHKTQHHDHEGVIEIGPRFPRLNPTSASVSFGTLISLGRSSKD